MTPNAVRNLGRAGLATAGLLAGELAYAVLRPAPEQQEFDASGTFGIADATPLHLGVMGDSSCTGVGLDGPEQIWVRQTAEQLANEGFAVTLTSVAVGGSRAVDLLSEQLPTILQVAPDVVMIAVGSNDALKGVSPSAFERDLDLIVGELSRTDALIVLSGVGDLGTIPRLLPPLRQVIRARARQFDAIHGAIAAKYGIPKAEQWTTAAEVLADRSVFSADRFHPGQVGHSAWADVAMEVLTPHLARFQD